MVQHPSHAELDLIVEHTLGTRLAGRPRQNINLVSTVQNYEIGSRLQLGRKVYHYAYAGGILIPDNGVFARVPQDIGQHNLGVIAVAGAIHIVITVAAADGPLADGSLPLNYLRGGEVVVFPGANTTFIRGILGNTAVVAPGGTSTLTLDAPIPVNVGLIAAEAIASPYRDVVRSVDTVINPQLCTVAGIATVPAVLGDFLWLQTWGPCWVAPDASVGVGIHNRKVLFGGDGAVLDGDFAGYASIGQLAGFVLANAPGGGQSAPFFQLMLDP